MSPGTENQHNQEDEKKKSGGNGEDFLFWPFAWWERALLFVACPFPIS